MTDQVPNPESGLEDEARHDPKAQFEIRNAARLDELEDRHHAVKLLIIQHWGSVLVFFMYGFAAVFAVSLAVVFWHYVTPENPQGKICWTTSESSWFFGYRWHGCLQWLTESQIHRIQSVLFSGGIGAFLTAVGQKYFGHRAD